jgi:hypothetical protein
MSERESKDKPRDRPRDKEKEEEEEEEEEEKKKEKKRTLFWGPSVEFSRCLPEIHFPSEAFGLSFRN